MADSLTNYHDVSLEDILKNMKIKESDYQSAIKKDRKQRSLDTIFLKATFAYRFSCCTCDIPLGALKEALGLSKTALFEYRRGESEPRLTAISKIAGHFNVSTDYLLGLSDAKTTKPDKKSACEYTGLSDEAIDRLHDGRSDKNHPLYSAIVSYLIESGTLDDLVKLLEKSLIQREQQSVLFDANDEQRANTMELQEYQFNKQLSGLYTKVTDELSKNLSGQITYIAEKQFLELVDAAMDTKEKMEDILDVARSDEKIWAAFIEKRASRE